MVTCICLALAFFFSSSCARDHGPGHQARLRLLGTVSPPCSLPPHRSHRQPRSQAPASSLAEDSHRRSSTPPADEATTNLEPPLLPLRRASRAAPGSSFLPLGPGAPPPALPLALLVRCRGLLLFPAPLAARPTFIVVDPSSAVTSRPGAPCLLVYRVLHRPRSSTSR